MTARRLWSHWFFRDALVPFVVTRLMLVVVGLLALHIIQDRGLSNTWQLGPQGSLVPAKSPARLLTSDPLLNMFSRWDSGWLLSAAKGYEFVPGQQSNVMCFPLYPLLMRGGAALLGGKTDANLLLAGLIISNAALLGALAYLILLARLDFDDETAARSAWYLLIFPATVFLSAVYTEGLFAALVLGAVYRARRGHWWRAGLLGAAASATRVNGFIILVPLLLEYLTAAGYAWRGVRRNVFALALVPCGAGAYAAFCEWKFGSPLVFLSAAGAHKRHLVGPWEPFVSFLQGDRGMLGANNSWLDFCGAVFVFALAVRSWWLLRLSYAAYATATLVFIWSTGLLSASLRYSVPLFPLFLVLGIDGRRCWFDRSYTVIATGLAAFFMAMFATWYWVT